LDLPRYLFSLVDCGRFPGGEARATPQGGHPWRITVPNEARKALSWGLASRYILDRPKDLLAAKTDELAGIHFSVLLTAKWERAEGVSSERRAQLRADLSNLRAIYYDKIDEIAMTFGIQEALDARKSAARAAALPLETHLSARRNETEQHAVAFEEERG
jgi:hypothetical protein